MLANLPADLAAVAPRGGDAVCLYLRALDLATEELEKLRDQMTAVEAMFAPVNVVRHSADELRAAGEEWHALFGRLVAFVSRLEAEREHDAHDHDHEHEHEHEHDTAAASPPTIRIRPYIPG